MSAQTTIVIDPKNANPALQNNAPVQTVTYTVNSNPVVQNASAVSNQAVTIPVFANSITVNPGSGNETLIFFNDIAANVRNNNFVANTGPNLGVYNTSTPTRVSIVSDGLAAFEAAVINASLNNNILNYLFYDGTLQNMPNASTADFDLLYYHAFTTDDYLVVGERDGNTFFALVPLGADGNPIPGANTVQFSPNPTPGPGNGHDWNTGYINGNDSFNTQPMYFTVASIEKFFDGTTVPMQDRLVYGYRIDNNGNADVKFFGASETTFTDNPVNPLLAPGSIGDFVWFDTDSDGIQDPGETGINGVTANLLDSFGNQVLDALGNPLTTVTANDTLGNPGFYEFPVVFPGDYQVEFVAPPEYNFTLKDQGANDAVDSDVNPSTRRTDVFTLMAQQVITTLDAGLVEASFVGDFVWIDTNGDGIQDPGETGLNGVTVRLLDSGNNIIATTTTANDINGDPGYYLFGNLDGGNYSVEFVLPTGYAFTTQNADSEGVLGGAANSDADPSTGRTSAFTIGLGSGTTSVDAGLLSADLSVEKSVTPASTNEGGTVTFTVTVTNLGPTATTGVVLTDALPAGLTFVNASADQGSYDENTDDWTVGALALNATATLTLIATTDIGTVGQILTNTASVTASDVPDPVSGNNSDDANVSVSALQITKTSDAAGLVNHGDIITYTVEVENVGAGTVSGVTVADLLPPGVTFVPGSVQASLDPVPGPPGTFTETINTTGAGSFTVPAGVTQLQVEAWGGGGGGAASGTNDAGGAGGGGAYARLNALSVTPGGSLNYSVGTGGGLPGPGNPGQPGQSTWFGSTSTLLAQAGAGGGVGTINAAGLGGSGTTSIGDVKWSGGNGGTGMTSTPPSERGGGGGGGSALITANGNNGANGGRNAPGAGGTGTGNGGNGGQSGSIQAQGGFAPGGGGGGCGGAGAGAGAAGQLLITYELPALEGTTGNPPNLASGWTLESGATLTVTFEVTVDNDAVLTEITNVASVTSDEDPDPLFDDVTDPVNSATVGDFVWQDTNGNGIQDGGEPGLAGVTVNLLDGNGDPVLNLSGNPIVTTTGTNGEYSFTGLPPGTYSVGFVLPAGYAFSPQNSDNQGVDGGENSDADTATGITPSVTLGSGQSNDNLDAGVYMQACPDLWTDWQDSWNDELDGDTGLLGNPDGDRYNNLIEYAFCLPPNLGARKPFCLAPSISANGAIDGVYHRTAVGGAKDVTYVLEWTAELDAPTTWTGSVTLDGSNTTFTDNGDGTETVRIPDLETLTGLAGSGFVRIRVDLDNGVEEEAAHTDVLGWVETEFDTCCTTYSNPFLECAVFTGLVDSVNGQNLVFSTSAAGLDISTLLDPGVAYYIEVETGDFAGHRFDVTAAGLETLTLADDPDLFALAPPFNTFAGPAPALLSGDRIALHRSKTLDQLFPPSGFSATGNQSTADRFQLNVGGQWINFWLYDDSGDARWVAVGDATFSDAGSTVIPPGRGIFFDNRSAQAVKLLAYGEVREYDFVLPLTSGNNLIGGGYPVEQSPRGPRNRRLNRADGFFGGRDHFTADTIFRWRKDLDRNVAGYETYFLSYNVVPPIERWVRQNDAALNSRDTEMIFDGDRSVFLRVKNPIPEYRIPVPWQSNHPSANRNAASETNRGSGAP